MEYQSEKDARQGWRISAFWIKFANSLPEWTTRIWPKGFPYIRMDDIGYELNVDLNGRETPGDPKNDNVKLDSLFLWEAYFTDDFDKLVAGLKKKFPSVEFGEGVFDKVRRLQDDDTRFGGLQLGFLTPDKFGMFNETSKYLRNVKLTFQKFTPSLSIIIFELHLTDEFQKQLKIIRDTEWKHRVTFRSLWPMPSAGAYSVMSSGTVTTFEVWSFLDSIRRQFEKGLLDFLGGYYLSRGSEFGYPKLPCIINYRVATTDIETDSFDECVKNSAGSLGTLGIDLLHFYWDRFHAFALYNGIFMRKNVYPLLTFSDRLKAVLSRPENKNRHESSVEEQLIRFLLRSVPLLDLAGALFEDSQKHNKKISLIVRRKFLFRIRPLLQNSLKTQLTLAQLRRIQREVESLKNMIDDDLKYQSKWEAVPNAWIGEESKDMLLTLVRIRDLRIAKAVDVLSECFEEVRNNTSIRNISFALRLTSIAILISACSILINSSWTIRNFLRMFFHTVIKLIT